MTDIRKAAEQARRTLKKAFNRIHCLPRTSDTELANEIEKNLAALNAALAAEAPATPSDAELVGRLEAAACNIPWVQAIFSDAAAAIERLTRDLAAAIHVLNRADLALAAEREARAKLLADAKIADAGYLTEKRRAEIAEARAEAAEARLKELDK